MELHLSTEWFAGWGTLALIIAAIAHAYRRSRGGWFILGLLLGPVALFILVLLGKIPKSDSGY